MKRNLPAVLKLMFLTLCLMMTVGCKDCDGNEVSLDSSGQLVVNIPVASAENETQKPDEKPSEAATPAATPQSTPEPTPEPDIEGVELQQAEWLEGDGEAATFHIVARIPQKNVKKGIMIGDFYAWSGNKAGTLEDWEAIMTPSDMDTKFETDETGATIVTFNGTLYWRNGGPTSDEVTIAVTGYDTGAQQETGISNTITLKKGQSVGK